MFILKLERDLRVPVEAECISCDVFSGKTLEETESLQIWEGNKRRRLDELFSLEDDGDKKEEFTIKVFGDLSKVRRMGSAMTQGKLIIEGDAGMHLGQNMRGGSIVVHGDAGSWPGSAMRNGRIEIMGNAGDYVASPYRGSTDGMKGGEIIIHGNAGNEAGNFMRGGLIRIEGDASQFLGMHMRDGTVLLLGNSDTRVGAEMVNGKIIVCGYVPEILPTFTIEDIRPSVKIDGEKINGPFYRFTGDLTEDGEGKLYISKPKNPHLSLYEEFL